MTKKIMLIDDSALMRRLMSDIINADSRLEVVDAATNGLEGLELLKSGKQYDLILLDINMPKMNGIAFLEEFRHLHSKTRVMVVSSIASRSTKETIQALELGAFDFLKKPDSYIGSASNNFESELMTKISIALFQAETIKQTIDWKNIEEIARKQEEKKNTIVIHQRFSTSDELVVIASSTGGPKSLQEVIPKFPADFNHPIVVIQHMPQGFTESLANRLDEMSKLPVHETAEGMQLKKGHVYIAKGGHQTYLVQTGKHEYEFKLTKETARNGLRPCADVFIESLAESNFGKIICSVMTGMGDDATRGLVHLKEYKSIKIISQDKESCVVYGMPRAIAATGIVDEVVGLENITNTIIKNM